MKIWDFILAALAVFWVGAVYFVAEPEPVFDWRVVAAFLQAILSAGAIYSAWWIQNRKRAVDRAEEIADNINLVLHLSALFEWDAAYVCDRTLREKTQKPDATVNAVGLRRTEDLLRKVNLAKLPGESIPAFLGLLQKADELTATLEWVAGSLDENATAKPDSIKDLYEHFFEARTRFLVKTGTEAPVKRKQPKTLGPGNEPVSPEPPMVD